MFFYWAFGLKIKSEICFPELFVIDAEENVDVTIKLGTVPIHPREHEKAFGQNIFIDAFRFKLTVPRVATYWAVNGSLVIIEKFSNVDESEVRLFCLSTIFAEILHQRNSLPLHASAIKVNKRLVLFCGPSGAGKSTLLGSFLSKGYEVFSDDVCVPFIDSSGNILMNASYPMMKFWRDTSSEFQISKKPDIQLRPDLDKYGFFFHEKFEIQALQPNLIFFIKKINQNRDVEIEKITGVELFQNLGLNVYRGDFLDEYNLSFKYFSLFSNLASRLDAYVVKRPGLTNTTKLICDRVEKIIQKAL